jgi:hypothetical protein
LSPRTNHQWSAASRSDLMFAVALYGPPVLGACDPDFALRIGADPQERAQEPIDIEPDFAYGITRVRRRRRRFKLWDNGGVSNVAALG